MILVVGAGRTGTSVVARVLEERLGVDMGGPGRVGASVPDGDYEDKEFSAMALKLWKTEISADEWRMWALGKAEEKTEPWGVKYPGHSEFMPTIIKTFPEAVWIWCQRDIWDTWQSWLRYFNLEPDEAWARLNYRNWAIQIAMLKVPHMEIDLTERVDEDTLERALGEGINMIAPGTLNNGHL